MNLFFNFVQRLSQLDVLLLQPTIVTYTATMVGSWIHALLLLEAAGALGRKME